MILQKNSVQTNNGQTYKSVGGISYRTFPSWSNKFIFTLMKINKESNENIRKNNTIKLRPKTQKV